MDDKLSPVNGVKPISPEQEELIHRLVYFQNEYEHPSEEDLKRIIVSNHYITVVLFESTMFFLVEPTDGWRRSKRY